MAVLTKTTEIKVQDIVRLKEIFNETSNPSKAAFERISNAKKNPIYAGYQ